MDYIFTPISAHTGYLSNVFHLFLASDIESTYLHTFQVENRFSKIEKFCCDKNLSHFSKIWQIFFDVKRVRSYLVLGDDQNYEYLISSLLLLVMMMMLVMMMLLLHEIEDLKIKKNRQNLVVRLGSNASKRFLYENTRFVRVWICNKFRSDVI